MNLSFQTCDNMEKINFLSFSHFQKLNLKMSVTLSRVICILHHIYNFRLCTLHTPQVSNLALGLPPSPSKTLLPFKVWAPALCARKSTSCIRFTHV